MIIRNIGVRHGRQALASSLIPSCSRAQRFSTEPTTPNPIQTATETPTPTSREPLVAPSTVKNAIAARKKALEESLENFRELERQKKLTSTLGAKTEASSPIDDSLQSLMAAQVHLGHNTARWNPANGRYIFGERDGIHIISLETTQAHLRRAARVVEEVAYHGGLILVVGTRPGHMPIVVRAAERAGACHLFQKWTPGTITNRETLLAGGLLQIVDEKDRPLEGFEKHLMDRRPVIPDLVVCLNPLENYTLLKECGMANIPTIGIIDTDADPTWVTYQIPANDDSLRSVNLIATILAKAGRRGQSRRHADADKGVITWETPREVAQFIKRDYKEKLDEMKKKLETQKETGKTNEAVSKTLDAIRNQLKADL